MRYSIRTKLMLLIGIPVVLTYLAVMAYDTLQVQQRVVHETELRMTDLVQNYAQQLDAQLKEVAQVARLTRSFVEIHPDISSDQVYAQLRANIAQNHLIYGAAMGFAAHQFTADQRLFCPYVYRATGGLEQIDIGRDAYDYLSGEWEWWNKPIAAEGPVWTDPYFDEGAGNILMCTYSVPFYRRGSLRGITTVDIPLEPLRTMASQNVPADVRVAILTQDGRFVYHADATLILNKTLIEFGQERNLPDIADLSAQILSGSAGMINLPGWGDFEGRQWVFYAPVPSTNWIYLAAIDEDIALAEVRSKALYDLLVLGLLLVLLLGAVWFGARHITLPIARLDRAASQIAEGQLDTPITAEGEDEIGNLAATLRDMTEKLAERDGQLQDERQRRFGQLLEGLSGNYYYYTQMH